LAEVVRPLRVMGIANLLRQILLSNSCGQ
jgi:hypothetical protein